MFRYQLGSNCRKVYVGVQESLPTFHRTGLLAVHAPFKTARPTNGSQRRFLSSSNFLRSQDISHRDYLRLCKIPNVWAQNIRLADLVEDLRELQAVEILRDNAQGAVAGREYKGAIRALIPLLQGDAEQVVKMSELEEAIPKGNGRAWRNIREKLEHNKIASLEALDEKTRALALFIRVNSVGAKRAKKFYDEGHRTLADLKKRDNLTHAQKVGLEYFVDFEALIPRSEVDAIATEVFRAIKQADPENQCEIVGSYRRGEPWSSDVDLVVRHPAFEGSDEDVSKALLKSICQGFKHIDVLSEKPLADGAKRYHTLVRLPNHPFARRLDLRMVGWSDFHYMLLGSTGDLELMKYLRHTAVKQGLFLSEYGMGPRILGEQRGMQKGADTFDVKRKFVVDSEEEIFEALGVKYIPPTKRSHKHWSKMLPSLHAN